MQLDHPDGPLALSATPHPRLVLNDQMPQLMLAGLLPEETEGLLPTSPKLPPPPHLSSLCAGEGTAGRNRGRKEDAKAQLAFVVWKQKGGVFF